MSSGQGMQSNAQRALKEVKRRANRHEREQMNLPVGRRKTHWIKPRSAERYQYIEDWLSNCSFQYVKLRPRVSMQFADPAVSRAYKKNRSREVYRGDDPFWWCGTADTVNWPFRGMRSVFLKWLLVGLKGNDKQIDAFRWLDNELECPDSVPPITELEMCKLLHVTYPNEFADTYEADGWIR